MSDLPTKEDVFDSRAAVGHTQATACLVISVSLRSWEDWEGGKRPMPSNLYRLYRHLVGIEQIPFIPRSGQQPKKIPGA